MAASLDDWASLYDSVYSYVRQDIPFYVQEALNSGGPVLELGCGTGRVSSAIAKTGVDLVGIDSSSKMLEVAQHKMNALPKASGAISLVEADMRDFSLDQRFPLIIIPFRGFLSLLTVGDQTKTLLNIKRHLTPNGRLVFNVFVPDLDMLAQDSDVQYHLRDVTNPDTGTRFVLWHLSDYDHHNQVVSTRLIIEELDSVGAVSRRNYQEFQLRYVHRWEMHHLLQSCGYDIVNLYGDFDRLSFDELSTEMVWVVTMSQTASETSPPRSPGPS